MKFEGNYNFYIDDKSVSVDDLGKLVTVDMTATVEGLNVFYVSPKKERLEMADKFKHQALEQIGIKDTGCKKQSSQAYYTNAEEKENIKLDILDKLFGCKLARVYNTENEADLKTLEFLGFSAQKKNKTEELLEEVNKYQEQNGGRVEGVEFPFETPTKSYNNGLFVPGWGFVPKRGKIIKYENFAEKEEREKRILEDWNKRVHVMSGDCERVDDLRVGKKETENKVDYGELDWDYIDGMALRMTKNLVKYPPKNWQKKIEIKELAKSAMRHARKILQGIDGDEETLQDHATALGNNGMMINFQLKSKNKSK